MASLSVTTKKIWREDAFARLAMPKRTDYTGLYRFLTSTFRSAGFCNINDENLFGHDSNEMIMGYLAREKTRRAETALDLPVLEALEKSYALRFNVELERQKYEAQQEKLTNLWFETAKLYCLLDYDVMPTKRGFTKAVHIISRELGYPLSNAIALDYPHAVRRACEGVNKVSNTKTVTSAIANSLLKTLLNNSVDISNVNDVKEKKRLYSNAAIPVWARPKIRA